jgi:hypothetical protein
LTIGRIPKAVWGNAHGLAFAVDFLPSQGASCSLDIESMPTIVRKFGFRVYYYSHEPNEPPHIHVDKNGKSAKYWLDPLQLSVNMGFSPTELNQISLLLREHQNELMEHWNGYFGTQSR